MGENGPQAKVARLIEAYELEGLGDELLERWTRTEDRHSLRDLATYFNRQLLQATLDREGADPLAGETENLYRLLTDDDVTSGVRQEARDHLEQRGVDVEALEQDFVSYQAVRTYLKSYRDASPPETSATPDEVRSEKAEMIQRLKNRLQKVARQALTDLKSSGHLVLGDFNIMVTVRVHCADCSTQRSVSELLSAGGCECDRSDTSPRERDAVSVANEDTD